MFKAPVGSVGWWFEISEGVILAIYWQASWSNKGIPMIIALENGELPYPIVSKSIVTVPWFHKISWSTMTYYNMYFISLTYWNDFIYVYNCIYICSPLADDPTWGVPGIFFWEPKVPGNSPIDVPMLKRSYVGGISPCLMTPQLIFIYIYTYNIYIYTYIYIHIYIYIDMIIHDISQSIPWLSHGISPNASWIVPESPWPSHRFPSTPRRPGGWCEVHGRGADFLFSVPGGAEGVRGGCKSSPTFFAYGLWLYDISTVESMSLLKNTSCWWFGEKRSRRFIGKSIEGVCYITYIIYI